ncbi:MAG: DNA-directed RNA polymerase subunit beta', partial [Mycoplasmataceae bacterium]|nr:DNA-directed RNA polymerase subunit beta' [Mycoplasmataceae bacterium]
MNNKNLLKQTNTAFDKVRIRIASKEDILSWSHGEVTKAETINYKTLKPEVGGLFDEAIFGPVKDYECACGKYKKVKHYGKTCEKCGVEITESIVRRERMGHIALTSPIVHIWMSKELPNPSKISLLLNISYKEVNQVIYFVNYIVLNPGKKEFNDGILKYKEIVDLASKSQMKSSRQKLRKLLQSITKSIEDKESIDYMRSVHYFNYLKNSSMPFSIEEVFNFITKYTGIKFGIGAEAIQYLLKEIDLEKGLEDIKEELTTTDTNSSQAKRLLRRLACFKWFKESANKPEWMVMNYIPVTPPETRPIIQLDGGRFTTSDINSFYHKIIIRNERLKKMIQCHAPAIIVNNEKRMLQDAVDALFDNSSRKKPSLGKDRRPLKSLSDHLKGKQGLFRQNLLGKRVDYSGRSVIVIGPELKMYEVGIPAIILLKLFKPFIIRELIRNTDEFGKEIKPIATNIRNAEKLILKQDDKIWPILERVIKDRPVLLNRAPTLHRLGIQAFEPKITNGKAIQLHPLVTTAFNADFDG